MTIIDGKAIAANQRELLKDRILALKSKGITPGLRVLLVGDNPSSILYVRNKQKAAGTLGIDSQLYHLPAHTPEAEVLQLVHVLNEDPAVHGILVQLPLPAHIDSYTVLEQIRPEKDIDGLNSINAGRLVAGRECIVPCTPRGIMQLIKSTGVEIAGKNAVVVGRSQIVGRPVAALLMQENATVTVCHSHTKALCGYTRQADILVVATGQARLITADIVKPGAIIIDVGNSYIGDKLSGDVDFENVAPIVEFITPVPGGVGPMTIAMLMCNTVEAAERTSR